jgi:hypothetical protein
MLDFDYTRNSAKINRKTGLKPVCIQAPVGTNF